MPPILTPVRIIRKFRGQDPGQEHAAPTWLYVNETLGKHLHSPLDFPAVPSETTQVTQRTDGGCEQLASEFPGDQAYENKRG